MIHAHVPGSRHVMILELVPVTLCLRQHSILVGMFFLLQPTSGIISILYQYLVRTAHAPAQANKTVYLLYMGM